MIEKIYLSNIERLENIQDNNNNTEIKDIYYNPRCIDELPIVGIGIERCGLFTQTLSEKLSNSYIPNKTIKKLVLTENKTIRSNNLGSIRNIKYIDIDIDRIVENLKEEIQSLIGIVDLLDKINQFAKDLYINILCKEHTEYKQRLIQNLLTVLGMYSVNYWNIKALSVNFEPFITGLKRNPDMIMPFINSIKLLEIKMNGKANKEDIDVLTQYIQNIPTLVVTNEEELLLVNALNPTKLISYDFRGLNPTDKDIILNYYNNLEQPYITIIDKGIDSLRYNENFVEINGVTYSKRGVFILINSNEYYEGIKFGNKIVSLENIFDLVFLIEENNFLDNVN